MKRLVLFLLIASVSPCWAQTSVLLTGAGSPPAAAGNLSPTPIISNQTGIDNAQSLVSVNIVNPSLLIYLNQPGGTFGGANNCLVVVAHDLGGTWAFGTPSDNIGGDTYTAVSGATGTQNSLTLKTWIVFGNPAGITKITIPTTGSAGSGFTTLLGGWAIELKNGCTATGGTGFLGFTANGSVHNLTLSSAPTSGDTVLAFAVDTAWPGTSSSCQGNAITFTAGWTPVADSECYGKMAELNSATTSTSVPITFAGTDQIAMVALVINKGSAGTSPGSGKYIDHEQAEQASNASASLAATHFPSSGNLAVILFNDASTNGVTSVSSTNAGSPTWATSCGPVSNSGNGGELVQIVYGTGATLSSTTTISLTLGGTSNGINPEFLSITNANASPFVKCTSGTTGNQTTAANVTTDAITPTNTGDFVFNQFAVDFHTITGLAADANSHTPSFLSAVDNKADDADAGTCTTGVVTPGSTLAGDNGYAVINTANTTQLTFIYTGTQTSGGCTTHPTGVNYWSAISAEFK